MKKYMVLALLIISTFSTANSLELSQNYKLISIPSGEANLDGNILKYGESSCSLTGGPYYVDSSGEYEFSETIRSNKGYYVRAEEESCELESDDSSSTSSELTLDEGWNIVSSTDRNVITAEPGENTARLGGCTITAGPWWWTDDEDSNWVRDFEIEKEKGYWVKAEEDCTVYSSDVPSTGTPPETDYEDTEEDRDSEGRTELQSSDGWTSYAIDYEAPTDVDHFVESEVSNNQFSFNTGDSGYCGKAYIEKEFTIDEGENRELKFSVNADTGGIYNGRLALWDNGEVIKEYNGENDFSSEWSHNIDEGTHNIRIGMESEGDLGCNQFGSRISLSIRSSSDSQNNVEPETPQPASLEEGYYQIENVDSGKEIEVNDSKTDNGADIQQWDESGQPQDNRVWYIKHPENNDNSYIFINKKSRKVMEVGGASEINSANVQQWTWNGGEWQQFEIIDTGNGQYKIDPLHTEGKVLDLNYVYNREENGVSIVQYNDNGGSMKEWKFNKVDTTEDSIIPVSSSEIDEETNSFSITESSPEGGVSSPVDISIEASPGQDIMSYYTCYWDHDEQVERSVQRELVRSGNSFSSEESVEFSEGQHKIWVGCYSTKVSRNYEEVEIEDLSFEVS